MKTPAQVHATRIGLFAIGALVIFVAAVASIFGARVFADSERALMPFEGSVAGLQVGAPVLFRGVRLGTVQRVELRREGRHVYAPVSARLDREALVQIAGSGSGSLEALVREGLRARLATQSVLTGQLFVELDFIAGTAPPAVPVREGAVLVPTTSMRSGPLAQLETLNLGALSDELQAGAAAARALLASPRWEGTLEEIAASAAALKKLAATLEPLARPLAARADGSLQSAAGAADRVGRAAERAGRAADAVAGAASSAGRLAEQLADKGAPTLAAVQRAADELAQAAAGLRAFAAEDGSLATALVPDARRALTDVSRAARALRELAEMLERQPQALLRGRAAAPEPELPR
jgi:paraquat-inducible protein B